MTAPVIGSSESGRKQTRRKTRSPQRMRPALSGASLVASSKLDDRAERLLTFGIVAL